MEITTLQPPVSGRRTEILAVARDLAVQEGMAAVTVRAVSSRAGIGIGTLRHYFPTQRDLFDALVVNILDDEIDDSIVMDATRPASERLARGVLQFLPADCADEHRLEAWFRLYVSSLGPTPTPLMRQLLEAAAARSHEHVRRWLTALADEGWLDAVTVENTANMLVALASGLCLETLTPGSPVTIDNARQILESAAQAVVRGQAS